MNLLNGPQDHGWCLGYTCQERISTFYGIVATGTNYSLYFTSNEPQKLRLHLLNSDATDAIRIGVFYKRPQRQDVYVNSKLGTSVKRSLYAVWFSFWTQRIGQFFLLEIL